MKSFIFYIYRNVPYIDVAKGVDPEWYAATRTTALVVILLRSETDHSALE